MKRLSHTSGEQEIAAAIVGKVSISCGDACDVFDQGPSKYLQVKHGFCCWTLVFVNLRATPVFTELQYLQPALIYCLLRKFLFGGAIFFFQERWARRELVITLKAELSSLMEWARPSVRQHSHTLPLDRLHDRSVSQGWFQAQMISALCVWRWSVISPFLVSSPSTSLKEVHC